MGLKPTIYKLKADVSDLNRNIYDTLNLTVARHPSETLERMMARVLALCVNLEERLEFSRGISAPEEPDIWSKTLDDQISLWIDVGEPTVDRVRKASRQASAVRIYSFNSKSDIWWKQGQSSLTTLPVSIFQFPWKAIQPLAALVERTLDLTVTITEQTVYISSANGECEVSWVSLQELT